MGKSLASCFFDSQCIYHTWHTTNTWQMKPTKFLKVTDYFMKEGMCWINITTKTASFWICFQHVTYHGDPLVCVIHCDMEYLFQLRFPLHIQEICYNTRNTNNKSKQSLTLIPGKYHYQVLSGSSQVSFVTRSRPSSSLLYCACKVVISPCMSPCQSVSWANWSDSRTHMNWLHAKSSSTYHRKSRPITQSTVWSKLVINN